MNKYIPHIIFFVSIFLIVTISIVTNSGSMGFLIGFTANQIIQPEIIISGLLIGFLPLDRKNLLYQLL